MRVLSSLAVALGVLAAVSGAGTEPDPVIALHGPEGPAGPMQFTMLGVTVTPHLRAEGLTYAPPTEGPLGARLQFFVRNDSAHTVRLSEVLFDRMYPVWHVIDGDWAWHDTPNEWRNRDRNMPPGAVSVWTVNAVRPTWAEHGRMSVAVRDWNTSGVAAMRAQIAPPKQWISSITFLGEEVHPSEAVVHVKNMGDAPIQMTDLAIWVPESNATHQYLYPREAFGAVRMYPEDGVIPAGELGIVRAEIAEALPLSYAALRVGIAGEAGDEKEALWGHVRVKRDVFDIAGGWVNSTAADGRPMMLHEPFLKALTRLYVNAAHIPVIAGYNDAIGEGGLYDRYPIKQFWELTPISKYDSDAMVAHVHGAELLGEPQLPFMRGHMPQQVLREFDPYARTRIPTTITLSDERTFRHYAGLSDYPHYDAYRVIAPAADAWRQYDRWPEGARIGWGSPLEGIGELSRVLRDLSRPRPCAIWSQGPHDNWYEIDGRTRLSPTAEELRSQAYHALATRIISLYWFNLGLGSLVQFRDTLEEMTRIGREIRMLEEFYMTGDAYGFERIARADGAPDWELSSIAAPAGALLFALDVDYAPDHEEKVFHFQAPRAAAFAFALPSFLRGPAAVFRVDADGTHDVDWEATPAGVRIRDEASLAAVYVAAPSADTRAAIESRREALLAREAAIGFDPANDDADFAVLEALLP